MATTLTETNLKKLDKCSTFQWTLASGETGDAAEVIPGDRCVQMFGTFGATVTLQGSLDGTNWFTLTDGIGNNIAMTSAGGKQIHELVRFIRPTAGAVTSVTVIVLARRGF